MSPKRNPRGTGWSAILHKARHEQSFWIPLPAAKATAFLRRTGNRKALKATTKSFIAVSLRKPYEVQILTRLTLK